VDVFTAIADPTRRRIVDECAGRERTAGDIAEVFQTMSRPNVSRHVRALVDAGVLVERREAQRRLFRVDGTALREVDDWVGRQLRFWSERIDTLEEAVRRAGSSS
jgi:DNA-binding transcriptional ArsR family regulator